jgi:hypothetical protein
VDWQAQNNNREVRVERSHRRKVTEKAQAALEEIQKLRGGILRPKDVVEEARPRSSPLHSYFTWDNGKAAEQWRLEEARRLIVSVRVSIQVEDRVVYAPAHVSLASDRLRSGGGFRPLKKVLDRAAWREELLQTALAELESMRKRYEMLAELAAVFAHARNRVAALARRAARRAARRVRKAA